LYVAFVLLHVVLLVFFFKRLLSFLYDFRLDLFSNYFIENCLLGLHDQFIFSNSLGLSIKSERFLNCCDWIKNHSLCKFFSFCDLGIVDFPSRYDRFCLHYIFLSTYNYSRILFILFLDELCAAFSLASKFDAATWIERESWDMFGIYFFNHPDLRRLLSDYGFEGFPLRKDFPLTGFFELRFDEFRKQILYEELELMQEFRSFFNVGSPWR